MPRGSRGREAVTQEELAQRLRIGQGTLSKYENGVLDKRVFEEARNSRAHGRALRPLVQLRPHPQDAALSPAMGAEIETRLWSMEDVVAVIDEHAERTAPNLADRLVG